MELWPLAKPLVLEGLVEPSCEWAAVGGGVLECMV